jgi:transposase
MEKKSKLTYTLSARIVKPLDGDWDALGSTLRALKAPLHRVLNVALSRVELASCFVKEGQTAPQIAQHFNLPPETIQAPQPRQTQNGKKKREVNPQTVAFQQTLCYRFVCAAWEEERKRAAEKRKETEEKLNVATSKLLHAKGDEAKKEGANQVQALNRALHHFQALAETHPSSSVLLGASSHVMDRWKKWDKERWRGTMTLPTFKKDPPIYLSSSSHAIVLKPVDGNAVLNLKVSKGTTRVVIGVDGGSAHATLRHLLQNPEDVGDAKLVYRRDKRTWEVRLTHTLFAREHGGTRTMAVHRGMGSLLTIAVARSHKNTKDAETKILEDGADILQHKKAYTARRRSLSQQGKQLGKGAKGHGVERRQERVTRLEDSEQRYVRTKCQEASAHLLKLAVRRGVGRILIEDWTAPDEGTGWFIRNWPWAQLLTCILWSAKKEGVTLEVAKGSCWKCPVCGSDGTLIKDNTTFLCNECRLERNRDVIYAWNMLVSDGKEAPVEEANKAEQKIVRKLKRTRPRMGTPSVQNPA